jgi:phosphatidate cytidylyltransferase
MLRILTAAILLPILWASVKLAPPAVFCGVAFLFVGAATLEALRVMRSEESEPFVWIGLVGTLALTWSFLDMAPRLEPIVPLAATLVITFVLAMLRRGSPRAIVASTLGTLFPVLLVGLGLGLLVGLRAMPGEDGEDLLMLAFACVMLSDTGAYYVGRTLGRHKMSPRLSPKKTWEGAAGGLLASVAGGCLAHFWFYQRLPLAHAIILGLLLGVAGIFGDLAESTLKRAAGVKDSSGLLPGHGGVLDRLDSLLFAGPILYYYYRWFLQGIA